MTSKTWFVVRERNKGRYDTSNIPNHDNDKSFRSKGQKKWRFGRATAKLYWLLVGKARGFSPRVFVDPVAQNVFQLNSALLNYDFISKFTNLARESKIANASSVRWVETA